MSLYKVGKKSCKLRLPLYKVRKAEKLLAKMSCGVYRDIPHLKAKVGKIKIIKVMKTVRKNITILRVVTTKINIIKIDTQREEELKKKEIEALDYFDQVMDYCSENAGPVQLRGVKQVQCLDSQKDLCHHEGCMDVDVIYQQCHVRSNPLNRKLIPLWAEGNCDTNVMDNVDTTYAIDASTINTIDSAATYAIDSSTMNTIDSIATYAIDSSTINTIDSIATYAIDASTINTIDSIATYAVDSSSLNTIDSTATYAIDSSSLNTIDSTATYAIDSSSLNTIDSTATYAIDSSSLNTIDSSRFNTMDANCHRRNSWKTWFRRQFTKLLCCKA